MSPGLPLRIAIIGAGSIGAALAAHLILAGNNVTIGARRPNGFAPPDYQRGHLDYPVCTIEEAVDAAEVAILAIPNAAIAPFAEVYRDRLAGAVIIDPSNPFLWHDDPATSRARHESPRTAMRLAKLSPAVVTAAMVALAAPARADPDADFANQLHGYDIYGPRDFNAWLGKITCERLHNGLDSTADKSAHFVLINLPRGTTTGQSYQFLGAAIGTYCPDQAPVLTAAAARYE
jgi:uncharacterized protein YbjT (DUF2867 family)